MQAGLVPFLVALITALLFRRINLSGRAIIAGFAVTIYLASDFTMLPFTAARKIVLLAWASCLTKSRSADDAVGPDAYPAALHADARIRGRRDLPDLESGRQRAFLIQSITRSNFQSARTSLA